MKKLLTIIVSISFVLVNYSQITHAEYFIDNDPGVGLATNIAVTTSGMSIDESFIIPTAGLSNGLHLLHIRAKGTNNVWSLYKRSYFYVHQTNSTLIPQNITHAEYFIDSDPGIGNATDFPITAGLSIDELFNIPTVSLSNGLHLLHIRTKDASNTWSLYKRSYFYIHKTNNTLTPQNITHAEYFIDSDPGVGSATSFPITAGMNIDELFNIPTISLSNGLHVLHIRVKDDNNIWSLYDRAYFYIHQPDSTLNSQNLQNAEYFIDNDPGVGSATSFPITAGLNIDELFNIPTTSLTSGLHLLHVRTQDQNNIWSLYHRAFFYIHAPNNNLNLPDLVEAEYFIDNDPGVGAANSLSITQGQTIDEVFNIPTVSLSNGLHILHIRVKDNDNVWSLYDRAYFFMHQSNNNLSATPIVDAEYFIDNDPGVGNGIPIAVTDGFDIAEIFYVPIPLVLNDGDHYLHVRAIDQDGNWSLFKRKLFVVDATVGDNTCNGVTRTWTGVWDDGNGDNSAPTNEDIAIIDANYDTNTNNSIDACSCTINAGKKLTIYANDYISIINNIINNGEIDVKNDGSVVQFHENATISGSGMYKFERITNDYLENDYTYWSSPSSNETIGAVFPANNPNNIFDFTTANFEDLYSGTYPQTLGTPDTFDDNNNDWNIVPGVTTMVLGKGYIAQGTGNLVLNSQTINFTNPFNTGTISVPVTLDNNQTDNADNDNLIGNPYPSSIDAIAFMLKNTILSGTLYFWTHNTQLSGANPGPDALNFTNNDYATWVAAGGVKANSGGQKPTDFIASCQGFFASVNANGQVVFDNSMRIKDHNGDFFRRPSSQENTENEVNLNGNQIWVNLTNSNGIFRQILIGFYNDATYQHDRLFDGKRLYSGNNFDFSSINENTKYAIQGLPNYMEEQIIPLSVKASQTGMLTISIDEFDEFFESQNIYLIDHESSITHDLKISNYTFNISTPGEFNNRFEILFRNNALSINNETVNQDKLIVTNYKPNSVLVRMENGTIIKELKVYDVLGKLILGTKINKSNFIILTPTIKEGTVLFLKATLVNNKILNKKFIKF